MTKPKVERGWMAWSTTEHELLSDSFVETESECWEEIRRRINSLYVAEYRPIEVEVEIRPIPKEKGVRRGK